MLSKRSFKSFVIASLTCTALSSGLVSCGGGGGGSVSPPPVSGGGGASAEAQVPNKFVARFPENGGFASFPTPAFTFFAPGEDLPQNLVLTGADAEFFQVTLDISAANAAGNRQVILIVNTSTVFNFEDPFDANKDNVYTFGIQGDYKGDGFRADIEVTITDVVDAAEAKAFVVSGEIASQDFSVPLVEIADFTGDGQSELGVSVQSGVGGASAYILTSERLAAITVPEVAVGVGRNLGTRFTTTVHAGAVPVFHQISGLSQADGTGSEILLSTRITSGSTTQPRLFVFPVDNAADAASLSGNINPATVAKRTVYTLAQTGGQPDGHPDATLIGDVNGDGINDIFVIYRDGTQSFGTAGIVFGRASNGGVQNITTGLDITFQSTSAFLSQNTGNGARAVKMISDIDGDGKRDMILTFQPFGTSKLVFLKSAALATASSTPIQIESLDLATQGFSLSGHALFDVVEGQDFDSDGFSTLYFFDTDFSSIFAIDGNAFAAIDPATNQRLYGNDSVGISRAGGQFIRNGVAIGDLDVDGFTELMGPSRFRQSAQIISGANLLAALNQPGANIEVPVFEVVLTNFVSGTFDVSDSPVYLKSQMKFAVPFITTNSGDPDSGKLILFNESDVTTAFTNGSTELLLTR